MAFCVTLYGKITTFDVPGAFTDASSIGTYTAFINDLGVVAGSYFDANTFVEYGYVRSQNGHFTKFAAPGAGTTQFVWNKCFSRQHPGGDNRVRN